MSVLFAREVLEDNDDYAYTMRYVLDPKMAFYRQCGIANVPANFLVRPCDFGSSATARRRTSGGKV